MPTHVLVAIVLLAEALFPSSLYGQNADWTLYARPSSHGLARVLCWSMPMFGYRPPGRRPRGRADPCVGRSGCSDPDGLCGGAALRPPPPSLCRAGDRSRRLLAGGGAADRLRLVHAATPTTCSGRTTSASSRIRFSNVRGDFRENRATWESPARRRTGSATIVTYRRAHGAAVLSCRAG